MCTQKMFRTIYKYIAFTLVLHIYLPQSIVSGAIQFPRENQPNLNAEQCGKLNEVHLYNTDKITAPDEFPWMGRVKYMCTSGQAIYLCLAVLFKTQYALVPAHCVKRIAESLEISSVLFGDWNISGDVQSTDCSSSGNCAPPPKEYEIEEIAVHPNFTANQSDHDIAVLKLKTKVHITAYVEPICLLPPREDLNRHIGQSLDVVGFYQRSPGTVRIKTHSRTTSHRHCIVYGDRSLTLNHICGIRNADRGLMSGSALMGINVVRGVPTNYYLIGILTTSSIEILGSSTPDVFMRIWPYRDWILNNSLEES